MEKKKQRERTVIINFNKFRESSNYITMKLISTNKKKKNCKRKHRGILIYMQMRKDAKLGSQRQIFVSTVITMYHFHSNFHVTALE